MTKQDRKSYNRAMILLVFGIFAMSWVMVNVGEKITSAIIYIVMGFIGIFLYKNWKDIGNLK